MHDQPPVPNPAPQTKLMKIGKKSNTQKSPHPNSRLIVRNNQNIFSSSQALEQLQSSDQHLVRPKTRNLTTINDDFVELPKVSFLQESVEMRSRSNSAVNIDLQSADDQQQRSNPKTKPDQENQLDTEERESQNGEEYGNWNIHNINIIPSKNNYIEDEQQYEVISGPRGRNYKETSLAVSRQANNSREKKKTEKDRNAERKVFMQRERRERERNIEIVSEFLSGKSSVVWLFILSAQVQQKSLTQIKDIYKDHIQNDYEVPICRSYQHSLKFLKIQSCFFKVVADIQSAEKLIEQSPNHKNIIAIYIYNPKKQAGINRSFEMKRMNKKVKGMFMDLGEAAKQASEDIQNEARFIQVDNQLEKERSKLRFPSFMILTGHDTTEVTAYRLCLYGSLKIQEKKQRENYLKEFTDMVELRYAGVPKELSNLQEYKQIDHFGPNNDKKAKEILNFYVRETFYYALTNSILRLSHSAEEFRPCTIPFNETYHAIKHYYNRYREQNGGRTKKMVTFRGAKLRNNDVKAIQVGSYIELLGFTSTSLKRSQAEKFMDNDSYLFEIIVDVSAENEKELQYDHGFVEINRYGLANEAYKNQEEILFNALNVFKVIALDLTSATRKITLQYGAIFNLLRSNPESLAPHQRAVISNYQYCAKTFQQIQDDGDVLLLAQDHDRCINYYQERIDQGERGYKIFGKIANAQLENGDLQEAYNNALKCLSELDKEPEANINEVKRNYSKYQKSKDIFQAKEDFVHFQATIDKYIKILGDDWFSQAKLLKQRGQKNLKVGDLQNCELDLLKAKEILKEKEQSFDKRRKQIKRRYMLRSFCCMCSRSASSQLQEQRQLEMLNIQADEVNFQNRKDQIHQLYLEIQTLLKEFAEKTGDIELFTTSQEQAKSHFTQMTKTNSTADPLVSAKFLMLEATLIEKQPSHSQQYDTLMQTAIQQIKKHDPFHESIGEYQTILGTKRHNQYKRKMLLEPIHREMSQEAGGSHDQENYYIKIRNEEHLAVPDTVRYNYDKDYEVYVKSQESYREAVQNIAYNKGSESPNYLEARNNLTQLDYDFSRLNTSEDLAEETTSLKLANSHSEGAKCYLLLAKICLAKGQLKKSFGHIQKAFEILRNSLLKIDTKQYNNIMMNHPYYMDISLQKVKIFNRQLKHDLALRQLTIIKKIAKRKIDNMHSKVILASIYQENAQILICQGETVSFQEYYTRAIEIRSEQMGKYNIPNAICYANLYKYLRVLNDSQDALSYHHKATQIFSRFPSDHPHSWIIHLSNGLYFYQKQQIDDFISQMQYCIKVATKRYSHNHISILKVIFQYGRLLFSIGAEDKALSVLLQFQRDLNECLSESLRGMKAEKEIDDEKLSLRKHLYEELKSIYSKRSKLQIRSQDQLRRIDFRLKEYQHLQTSTEKLMKSSQSIK